MLTADCTAEENFALECSRLCLPLPAVALLLLDAASTTEVSVLKHSLFILPNCFNYPARARAVTGRRNSHRWEGGRLFEPSAGLFYGNSCNSGTESRKIVSKVGN